MRVRLWSLLLLGVPSLSASPGAAQDQFGGAVAVADGEVLVAKLAATRGPAAVFRYTKDGSGAWARAQELRWDEGTDRGVGFSGSMGWSGQELLVGSGDPDAALGAHVFAPGSATWDLVESIPLRTVEPRAAEGGIDLATVMRIIQPAPRTVAVAGDRALISVTGTQVAGAAGVRTLSRSGAGWAVTGEVIPPEGAADPQFGAALATAGDVLVVGSPAQGRAFVYVWEGQAWGLDVELPADSAIAAAGFGATVATSEELILVAAVRAGVVRTYRRDGETWAPSGDLLPPTGLEAGFGLAVAVRGDEAWVGAPGAEERKGAVARYRWSGEGGWEPLEPLPLAGAADGYGAGIAMAIGEDVAVVGAPLANGAQGRAAVYTRTADGDWGDPTWVDAGGTLETLANGEVRCQDGEAAGFACSDVDLLAFLSLETLGARPGESMSDVWGWTDPETRRDYALVGRTGGATIVDVTNPAAPTLIGTIAANPSGARDLKVYRDHLFFTGDGAGNHGLVVFDLTRLRTVEDTPAAFEPDAVYDGIASAHNLVIDTEAGFAYPVGASGGGTTCGGGLHMVDIRDPVNPTFAGCFTDTEGLIWQGRTHDAQCTVYRGPDSRFQQQQICFVSNETALRIVDVTDKENPVPLGVASYPGVAYIHQGWLTDDQRYFYLNDELDELVGSTDRTRTLIWDVSDLEDPVLVGDVYGPDAATDHNLFIAGDRMYQANYRAGLRVWDISDPESPESVGFFDTTPWEGNPPGFTAGAWTAWPFFESGTVVVSSIHEGLFLLRPVRRELIP